MKTQSESLMSEELFILSHGMSASVRVHKPHSSHHCPQRDFCQQILSTPADHIKWDILQRKMLQRTVFVNKIRMLQRTRRNTIGRRITRVRMTFRVFPLWLERQSSSLLSVVRFSYQFSSVNCSVQKLNKLILHYYLYLHFWFCIIFFLFKWLCWMVTLL